MKAIPHELEGCFSVELEAETLEDASWLVRLKTNYTKELRSVSAFVSESGRFSGTIVVGKSKNPVNSIQRSGGRP
jgi:hypothetical protein